jgi:hypothetical protein
MGNSGNYDFLAQIYMGLHRYIGERTQICKDLHELTRLGDGLRG